MPADTIQVAGQRINRRALYLAGAVAVGVVGYAWWTRKPAPLPPEAVTEGELDALGDERIPTTGVPYDPNFGAPDTGIVTNAQWAQFATDRLQGLGYDTLAVSEALGKFLDRRPLTLAEANIARAAIGQAGEPPQGKPWPVIEAQPVAEVGLLAPTGLSVDPQAGGGFIVRWAPVQGAVRYRVAATEPNVTDPAAGIPAFEEATFHAGGPWPERAGKMTRYHVQGMNAAGKLGPAASIAFTIPGQANAPGPAPAPAPSPAPAPGPSVPTTQGSVAVQPLGRDRYMVAVNATPGATNYRVRWETGGEASGWAGGTLGPMGVLGTYTWLFDNPPVQFAVRVQAGNSAGWDPHGIVSSPLFSQP